MTNPQKVMDAIRALRDRTGLSQSEFARTFFKKTLPTQQRWETLRPPKGVTLAVLVKIARDHQREDLADTFKAAAIDGVPPEIRDLISEPTLRTLRKRASL